MRELLDSSEFVDDPEALLSRLRQNGYIFLRGLLPAGEVRMVRHDVLDTLRRVGWAEADDPSRPTGDPVPEQHFREGAIPLQRLESAHRLGYHPRLRGVVRSVLPDAFAHTDRVFRVMWPPKTWPGVAEFVHQDFSVFRVPDMLTAWLPLGDAPRRLGPLKVLTGSHRDGLISRIWMNETPDVSPDDPRWATADMEAGDVLLFHCMTVHTGTRNMTDRFRLSMDVRWQSSQYPAPEVARWPHVDMHFRSSPTAATHPGWDELAAGWSSRETVEFPPGVQTFDHTSPDLPQDHPRPSYFVT